MSPKIHELIKLDKEGPIPRVLKEGQIEEIFIL